MKTGYLTSLIAVAALSMALTGCWTDRIDAWSAKGCVWFTSTDTLAFTFAAHTDSTAFTVELPITLAGNVESVDREINVTVSSDTRNDSTRYEIIRPVVIPADSTHGVLRVRVYKTDNLNHARDTVSFRIQKSDALNAGLVDYRIKTLIVYNHFVKPDWWDADTWYVIGRYTELKLSLIYKVLGDNITTTPFPRYSDAPLRIFNVYKMNQYLEKYGPFYDYDGKLVQFTWGFSEDV